MKKIAVHLTRQTGYFRSLIRGIFLHSNTRHDWDLRLIEPRKDKGLEDFTPDRWDALITMNVGSPPPPGLITLITSAKPQAPGQLSLDVDDVEAGAMAARYFLGQGYRHFAFAGIDNAFYSNRRKLGFVQTVETSGAKVHLCDIYKGGTDKKGQKIPHQERVRQWVAELPKPVGLFVCADGEVLEILKFIRGLDIRIPEDLSIIGAENDDLLCNLNDLPLTSVDLNSEGLGMRTAEVLEGLLEGQVPRQDRLLVAPNGVVARSSTGRALIHDGLRSAVAYVRTHFEKNIGVIDMARAADMERRSLELTFRKHLGITPRTCLENVRLDRARQLLLSGELSVRDIAKRCGFSSSSRFCVVFQKRLGCTPGDFRRQELETEKE